MMQRLITEWSSQVNGYRRKVTKKDMEEASEMAALVDSVFNDIVKQSPLKKELVVEKFIGAYSMASDPHLPLELANVLQEKPEQVKLESFSIVKQLLLEHQQSHGQTTVTVMKMTDLEQDNFNILVSSMKHDAKAVLIYLQKCRDAESQAYWAKLEDEQNVLSQLESAVKALCKRYVKLVGADSSDTAHIIKQFLEYKREILNKPNAQINSNSLVPVYL